MALTHSLAHTSFLLFQKTNESVDLVFKGGEKCNHQLNACWTFIVISHAQGWFKNFVVVFFLFILCPFCYGQFFFMYVVVKLIFSFRLINISMICMHELMTLQWHAIFTSSVFQKFKFFSFLKRRKKNYTRQ